MSANGTLQTLMPMRRMSALRGEADIPDARFLHSALCKRLMSVFRHPWANGAVPLDGNADVPDVRGCAGALHAFDDRRVIVVVPRSMEMADSADNGQHYIGLPWPTGVFDAVKERGDVAPADAGELAVPPLGEDVLLEAALDLALRPHSARLDAPLEIVLGRVGEGHAALAAYSEDGRPRPFARSVNVHGVDGADGRPDLLSLRVRHHRDIASGAGRLNANVMPSQFRVRERVACFARPQRGYASVRECPASCRHRDFPLGQ